MLFVDLRALLDGVHNLRARGILGDFFGGLSERAMEWPRLSRPLEERVTWLLRDDAGRVVRMLDVRQAERAARPPYVSRHRRAARAAEALGLPIPWTGKPRGRHSSYLRHPLTTSERRADAGLFLDEDELGSARIAQRRFLPTAWNDICRGRERSWKRHRRTQWHP